MVDEYPREYELETIKNWDLIERSVTELLDYVQHLWKYDDRFVLKGKRVLRLYLSTGGWSGNEDIVDALQQNFLFWNLYWVKHTKGGHYWFRIPLKPFKRRKKHLY